MDKDSIKPNVTISDLSDQRQFQCDESWGPHFDNTHGAALSLPAGNTAAVFLDARLSSTVPSVMQTAFTSEGIRGHVVSCFGEHWEVHIEPLKNQQFGIIVYSAKGKALLHGTGSFDEARWSAKVKTLYDGIKNERHLSVSAIISGGSGEKTDWGVAIEAGGTIP